jgi:hypothetical protein
MKGEFFAVGKPQFLKACQLGMNPAVTLLIMARGTIVDNVTTSWSAQAVFNHSGMARRRAQKAITELADAKLVKIVKGGTRPRYKLHKPKEDDLMIWLPNTLIDGAGKEVPPITRLRESCSVTMLQKFIELYGEQDLETDGGIPRSIAWVEFKRTKICPVGPFTLYGFEKSQTKASSNGIFAEFAKIEDDSGNRGAWTILSPLAEMGLLQYEMYVAESPDKESELIYPVNVDTNEAIDTLLNWLEERDAKGFTMKAEEFEYHGIALDHIKQASMVGLLRLTYRAKTSKTSRWWARDCHMAEVMTGLVERICFKEEFQKCAHQG